MEVNIGAQDKKIRIIAGAVLLALGLLVFKGNGILLILGLVLLVTGVINFCPAYKLLGMNTLSGSDSVGKALDSAKDSVSDAADAVGKAASNAADKAAEMVDDVADKVKKG